MKVIDNKVEFQAYIGDEIIFENINSTGMFNTSLKIIPLESFSGEEVKKVLRILNRKINVTIESITEEKTIQELKNKRFTKNQKQIASKINELIREVNKLKEEGK